MTPIYFSLSSCSIWLPYWYINIGVPFSELLSFKILVISIDAKFVPLSTLSRNLFKGILLIKAQYTRN